MTHRRRRRAPVSYLALALLVVTAALAALAGPAGAVDAHADLVVTKTGSPEVTTATSNVTYTITVKNNGPDDAQTVSLTDEIPEHTTFISFTAPAGWTSTAPAGGGTGPVSSTAGTLANGTTATFTLVVNVDEDPPPTTTIFNTANATSAT